MASVARKFERAPLTSKEHRVVQNRAELIRVAKQFKREKTGLDMSSYGQLYDTNTNRPAGSTTEEALAKPECGTTVCLAGRAGLDPYFRKIGVRFDASFKSGDYGSTLHAAMLVDGSGTVGSEELSPKFDIADEDGNYPIDENYDTFCERVFYGKNEYAADDTVDKAATLDRIIAEIKRDTLERFQVRL